MTIDRVPAAASPRIEKSTVVFAQAPSANGEGNALESGQPSFSSVLSTLSGDSAGGGDAPASKDAATVQPDVPLYPPAGQVPLTDAALDPALLLAQMTGAGAVAVALPPQVPSDALPEVSELPSLRSSPLPPGAGSLEKGPELPGLPLGQQAAMAADPGAADADPATDAGLVSTAPATQSLRRSVAADLHANTIASARDDAQALRSGDGRQDPGDLGAARGDWRATLATSVERAISLTPLLSEAAGSGFRSLPALRSSERQAARSVFLPLDATAPGSVAPSTYGAQSATGFLPTAMPEAPMAPGASADVAQKVHYWVTRGVQNAELQLDAFGGSAVDVSISLQGKEALVEFRSDQPEARRVLQDAMPQLRDMLRNEGLQLAGGFVGTSAQQQDDNQQRTTKEQAMARTGTVSLADAAADRGRGQRPATPHALDVFV